VVKPIEQPEPAAAPSDEAAEAEFEAALAAAPSTPPTRPAEPPTAAAPAKSAPPTPAKASVAKAADLRARLTQLATRVEEIARVAPKSGRAALKLVVEEHVALARLLGQRLDGAGADGTKEVADVLRHLGTIADAHGLSPVFGLKPAEFDDWGKVANDAKLARQALAARAKKA
jgi:hypothetical protein